MSASLNDPDCLELEENLNRVVLIKKSNDAVTAVGSAIAVFLTLYLIFCLVVFMKYRHIHFTLYKRNRPMLLLFTFGIYLTIISTDYRHFVGATNFPCSALFGFSGIGVAFSVIAVTARVFHLISRIKFNQALVRENYKSLLQGNFDANIGSEGFVRKKSTGGDNNPGEGTLANREDFLDKITKEYDCVEKYVAPCLYFLFRWRKPSHVPQNLHFKLFLASERTTNILTTIFGLLVFPLVFVDPDLLQTFREYQCQGCAQDATLRVSIYQTVPSSIVALIVLRCFVTTKDGLNVRQELVGLLVWAIGFSLLLSIVAFQFDDFEEEGKMTWHLLYSIQKFFFLTYTFPYRVYLGYKAIKNEAMDETGLDEILDDDYANKAFALYLGTNLSTENIYYYNAIRNWKKNFDEFSPEMRRRKGRAIFDNFISWDGMWAINIGHKEREELEIIFAKEDADLILTEDMFNETFAIIKRLLAFNHLDDFKKSIYYQAYIGSIVREELSKASKD